MISRPTQLNLSISFPFFSSFKNVCACGSCGIMPAEAFAALGLRTDASVDDVKKAYRKLGGRSAAPPAPRAHSRDHVRMHAPQQSNTIPISTRPILERRRSSSGSRLRTRRRCSQQTNAPRSRLRPGRALSAEPPAGRERPPHLGVRHRLARQVAAGSTTRNGSTTTTGCMAGMRSSSTTTSARVPLGNRSTCATCSASSRQGELQNGCDKLRARGIRAPTRTGTQRFSSRAPLYGVVS
jgi:hypothetical protein